MRVGLKTLGRHSRDLCLRSEPLYRIWLDRFEKASLEPGPLAVEGLCRTLKSESEWKDALEDSKRLRLPLHPTPEKNWDTRIIVAGLLANTDREGLLLDAGAERYSQILSTLYAYGRRELLGINLTFRRPLRRGPIRFRFGDITDTGLPPNSVAGVGCQSVIEHGVPVDKYLKEMARILRPGGVVITSTDYYPEPVETDGLLAYGEPVKIFDRRDLLNIFELAHTYGLSLVDEPDLDCEDAAVCWQRFNLRYTFVCFALRKGPTMRTTA